MDELAIAFPMELVIEGVPISLQGRTASKNEWKEIVRQAARDQLEGFEFAHEGPLGVTIFYFPDAEMQGDVDNIVKPILDALKNLIFVDDRQVERVVVQKFEPNRIATFRDPSAALADAISIGPPVVYIRLDPEFDREGRG